MRFDRYTRGGVLTCMALVAVIAVTFLVTSEPVSAQGARKSRVMQIHYLEIVTKEVDVVCAAYAVANGVRFGDPDAGLGNARTAAMPGGGLVGVRAPMNEAEEPVVRPYWLVDDIKAAVAAAVKSGGEVAHPPMEIPGHGTFAIYIQSGVQHGLWKR
jgi:predicted enzyme related to lactoylglutathione lyase